MRLEQIVIQGFKSFADKTEVRILPGITCIVGPNGCGKSNVADAIRWALGEQSAKMLRGQHMADVIFHGSSSRKPVGLAEVALVFDNDGALAVPYSEVAVARRLYRSGESEYLLNKSGCRLRDIQDLLAGTGVNPKAYALMDQERLNHVLTAKPWERRIFIEEAAGVARYKQQREEAQHKLDATRENLERIRAVMHEVKSHLSSLERQARRAQQYKALHQEKQALGLAMLAADFAALTERGQALSAEIAGLRGSEEQLRARLATLGGREALERAAIQEVEYRLADLRQSTQKFQSEAERLLERRDQMSVQLRELEEEDVRLGDEMGQIAGRQGSLQAEREAMRTALADVRATQEAHLARLSSLEALLEQARAEVQARRGAADVLRLRQMELAARRAELAREHAELSERSTQLGRGVERVAGEQSAARAERERLLQQRGALEHRARAVGTQLSLLEAEHRDVRSARAAREAERDAAQASLAEHQLALAARRSALEALERLEREREGYGAGVRAVFASASTGALTGVVGTVADLLEVPAGLEQAVESVLGDRLQWVVVERFAHARAAVESLERAAAGPATFLPLETLHEDGPGPEDSGDVRWAARLVGGPQPGLVRHLLGGVGVVAHLDQAEALWRRNGVVATYVTPAGEVLTPTGRLTGGRRDGDRGGAEHSLLWRKGAIRELSDEVAALELATAEARGALETAEGQIQGLRERETTLVSSVQVQASARLSGEKDLESAQREEERVARHLETLDAEARQLEAERGEAAGRRVDVEAALGAAEAELAGAESEAEALRAHLEAAQAEEGTQAAALGATRVDLAAAAERVEALARDIDRLGEIEAETRARLEQAELRRGQLRERRRELQVERERADAGAREAAAGRDRLETEVRAAGEVHAGRVATLQGIEAETRAAEHERDGARTRLHEVELAETEGRVRREELLHEARRAHGAESAESLLAARDTTRGMDELRARHDELSAKLESMGPVNLVADEEYREQEERLTFLRTQHDDLAGSMKDLDRALRGMTQTAQQRFEQAFVAINERFGEIFARLFEGGRAELRMVEPEEGEDNDPLELGVELMAQPRGKRLQAVSLMSGGEKALTGLALLFAIFYYRPSPFCVLDEVDAPLDDANIHRFLRVLRELVTQTQFVVITHNRKTMEAADVLYGVTMEEPGLSRLVSVNLTD